MPASHHGDLEGVLPTDLPAGPPTALLAHGAGSSAEFVLRAFGGALGGLGYRTVSWQQDGRGGAAAAEAALDRLATALRPALVGGVSLGAHAAAAWAARTGYAGRLLLVMPAWSGRPGRTGLAALAAADEIARLGLPAALARVRAAAHPWVAAELALAWPRYGAAGLVEALRAAAVSRAPTPAELGRIAAPTALVALSGDPLHPAAVAAGWARLIPAARLVTVPLGPADRAAGPDLGAAAAVALSGSRRSPDRAPGD
ncbi:MAG: alpha/beta fold hydrolase [Frankiaceae bacterium]